MEQQANLKYEAIKVNQDEVVKIADEILVEAPLQININQKSFTVVMRTPGADLELSLGLLVNEGVLKKDVDYRIHQENENILDIEIREEDLGSGYLNARSLYPYPPVVFVESSPWRICILKDIKIPKNRLSQNQSLLKTCLSN